MPRITRVYTRTGDDGTTALGNGQRVPKTSPRIVAYGLVDELNSCVGAALAAQPVPDVQAALAATQNELLHLGADLCIPEADKADRPGPRIETRHVERLERVMDAFSERLEPLANFVLPGGDAAAAWLHVCRCVCRRAECAVVALADQEPIGPQVVTYLNRLSDALFVMARYQNRCTATPEPLWDSRA
jgi:cob(I)alamin adenosyltransferase